MLYLIGIGIGDEKDITLKGLEAVKKCSKIYLESYTSKLQCSIKDLEKLYNKKIIIADRKKIEQDPKILNEAKKQNITVLVIGDPFSATTHISLVLEAKKKKIKTKVIHNTSILNAVGETGLELYKFGKTTSIPFDNKNVKAPIEVLGMNLSNKLHTLFLLDLKDGKYMTINQALEYLLKNNIGNKLCVAVCALGSDKQIIKFGNAKDLLKKKFTKTPQCLIVPAELHFIEKEALDLYK